MIGRARCRMVAIVLGATLSPMIVACGDESDSTIASRGEQELAQYVNDPLTAPIEIRLEQAGEPAHSPAEPRGPDPDDGPRGRGYEPTHIEYWFGVPAESNRADLLDAGVAQLIGRGWDLVVDGDDVKVLTLQNGRDHLKTTLVMPREDSDRLLQEITVEP